MINTFLRIILIIVFFFVFIGSKAQNITKIDSLKQLLITSTVDSITMDLLGNISSEYIYSNADSCSKYADIAIKLGIEKNDTLHIAHGYNSKGGANCIAGNLNKALQYFTKSKELFHDINFKEGEAGALQNIGIIYEILEEHDKAIEHYISSAKIFHEINNEYQLLNTYYNLASSYIKKGDSVNGRKNLNLILNSSTSSNHLPMDMLFGSYFQIISELDSAEFHFRKQYHSAVKNKDIYTENSSLIGIGEVLVTKKNYLSALHFYRLAEKISKTNNYEIELLKIYGDKTAIFDSIGNYQSAYEQSAQHQKLQEEITDKELENQLGELKTKYESQKYEQEATLSKALLAKAEILNKSNEYKSSIILIFSIIIMAILLLYIYVKKVSHKKLSKQKIFIENQQSKILTSINYAKKIQDSILKDETEVSKIFPSSFVYFKPKAIVSGDFYWMKEFKGIKVVATVDCIGHGVPGAFMSLIANNLLEKYVQPKHLENPGNILTKIHQHLISESKLNPDQQGMDMSISVINEKEGTLSFAGARNSAFIYNSGDFKKLIATPYSIGSDFKIAPAYKTELYHIKENDKLYMYTDGFIDQFGGDKSKKMNKKRFKNLITELEGIVETDVQSHIKSFIKKWQGELSQTDDILIIGVQF